MPCPRLFALSGGPASAGIDLSAQSFGQVGGRWPRKRGDRPDCQLTKALCLLVAPQARG